MARRLKKQKPKPPLEWVEEAGIMALVRSLGGKVYKLSQSRATRQTPGIPDLYAVIPLPAGAEPPALCVWIEVKREYGAVVSKAQHYFQLICGLAGHTYLRGSLVDVEVWAVERGLMEINPAGQWLIPKGRHLPKEPV